MAERQSKLGDSWNDCAIRLLKLLGWKHVGNKDVDLKGSDDKEYGVDSLMVYEVAGKTRKQTAILESKRYAIESIKNDTLQKWIDRLKEKLNALRNSPNLISEFKELEDCSPTNLGIIMVWVHDADEAYLNGKFQRYLKDVSLNTGAKPGAYSRIMVLDNRRISMLCAMVDALKGFDDFNFVYPAGIIDNDTLDSNKTLSVEYMMSDIIMAECRDGRKKSSVVFYFGKMTEPAVSVMMECLKVYQRVDSKKPLLVYYYDSSNDTINVINSFKNKDSLKKIIEFRKLTHYAFNDEPSLIANDDR